MRTASLYAGITTENGGSMKIVEAAVPAAYRCNRCLAQAPLTISRTLPEDIDHDLAIRANIPAIHPGSIEGQSHVALLVDRNQATGSTQFRSFIQRHLRCLN